VLCCNGWQVINIRPQQNTRRRRIETGILGGAAMVTTLRLKQVRGPNGRYFTLADLPPINLKRWYASHKVSIVLTVRGGLITADEICRRYHLSLEELTLWENALTSDGVDGLRSTPPRQASGHQTEKDRGRAIGRKPSLSGEHRQIAQDLLSDPAIPIAEIAKRLNISKQSFYRHFPGGRRAVG